MKHYAKVVHVGNRHVELTNLQRDALLLWGRTPGWKRSAYPGVNLTTVYALHRRGMLASADKPGAMALPQNHSYKLTRLGLEVFEVINRDSA